MDLSWETWGGHSARKEDMSDAGKKKKNQQQETRVELFWKHVTHSNLTEQEDCTSDLNLDKQWQPNQVTPLSFSFFAHK